MWWSRVGVGVWVGLRGVGRGGMGSVLGSRLG